MVQSFKYAGEGLAWIWNNHRNFRIFILAAFLVLLGAWLLGVTRGDFTILVLTIVLCIMAEIVNTALEEITDLITIKWSQQAKVVKDVGAAMSLIASISAVCVGLIIFLPYLVGIYKLWNFF